MKVKKHKVKIITLGCSKNLVDSEHLMAMIKPEGIEIVNENEQTDTLIINTCGFIDAAKEESIHEILCAVKDKESGKIKNLYIAGCLSERYKKELEKEIPEVDKYFGSTDKTETTKKILQTLGINFKKELTGERLITTPRHFAYLKISEGCNNSCSFCAIPIMRGKHKSRRLQEILSEVNILAVKGVKEIIIIGQDTTSWGLDIYGKRNLSKLLEAVSKINGIEWIRLMYTYPSRFPEDVIQTIKNNEKICKYIDIPIQHISDKILKSMQRGITQKATINLLGKMRTQIPEICIRSTLITGYPGETDKEFSEMLEFVKDFKFDRLGVFTYSHEENTDAYYFKDSVRENEKVLRQKLLLEAQRYNSIKANANSLGKVFKIIIDRKENNSFVGRTYKDAPEIDQEVIINYNDTIETGNFYNIRIYDYEDFDLFGDVELYCK
ncbi:MAG: 30S ribosomal protein S12 methylthiotransferase RimO [Ignavibacteria bacterium]|nr:30S ribosomal protein S12 methylthiotransferase RimO [Ignavibacteria bacterium]